MKLREVNFWYWLVRLLPNKLVYFCFMHVMAYSTTGRYGTTIVPELSGMEAIERYGNDKGIDQPRQDYEIWTGGGIGRRCQKALQVRILPCPPLQETDMIKEAVLVITLAWAGFPKVQEYPMPSMQECLKVLKLTKIVIPKGGDQEHAAIATCRYKK